MSRPHSDAAWEGGLSSPRGCMRKQQGQPGSGGTWGKHQPHWPLGKVGGRCRGHVRASGPCKQISPRLPRQGRRPSWAGHLSPWAPMGLPRPTVQNLSGDTAGDIGPSLLGLLFFFLIFICVAVPGLSCGTRIFCLRCSMLDF